MKITTTYTSGITYKSPISFKSNYTSDTTKTTQFEKNLKPLATKPVKKGFFAKLGETLKDFFETNPQSTIAASTFGFYY